MKLILKSKKKDRKGSDGSPVPSPTPSPSPAPPMNGYPFPSERSDSSRGSLAWDEAPRLGIYQEHLKLEPKNQALAQITNMAVALFQVPMAAISVLAQDRVALKYRVGFAVADVPLEGSLCSLAVQEPEKVTTFDNCGEDENAKKSTLVKDEPKAQFYAGCPLVTTEGFVLGTLFILDTVPRRLEPHQLTSLQALTKQAATCLEAAVKIAFLESQVGQLLNQQATLQAEKEAAETAAISSFENLLLSQAGLTAFETFLEEEFCAENLQFWKESRDFRAHFAEHSPKENLEIAEDLYKRYVKAGAIKEVNISSRLTKGVEDRLKAGSVNDDTFEATRAEAFGLMKRDSYQRFLKSAHYANLLKTVNQVGLSRLHEPATLLF